MTQATECPLCSDTGGEVVWQSKLYRVVLVDEPDYPGFCRVILNRHVAEMTDLKPEEQSRLMQAVFTVEQVLRQCLAPDKINLASLGNVVPHVHWHVIPRWYEDRHFPNPIWGSAQRSTEPRSIDVPALKAAIASALLLHESSTPETRS